MKKIDYEIYVYCKNNAMVYWCYFLHSWDAKIIENIETHNVITFPVPAQISENDVIIIYNRKKPAGFVGYVRANSILEGNKKKIMIFDDRTLNKNIILIKYCALFKSSIKKSSIFGDDKNITNEFMKHVHADKYMVNLTSSIGLLIQRFIRSYTVPKKTKTHKKVKKTCSEKKCENQVKIKKSMYIIPIMIIPCKEFNKQFADIDKENRAPWIFSHITSCRLCDITNNNERISIDMLSGFNMKYKVYSDDEKIMGLLDTYHKMGYYKMENIDEKNLRIIRMNNIDSNYHKCFCVVAKLDCYM